ncbi:uncharacterized protein LOC141623579 isoform X2 [Silene latifolia]|uniref:uncharacterized protein LOC141623579 isoform X2 n=1 Tax=Silene latifolia TaxID=37657 RepID=UPI003D78992E
MEIGITIPVGNIHQLIALRKIGQPRQKLGHLRGLLWITSNHSHTILQPLNMKIHLPMQTSIHSLLNLISKMFNKLPPLHLAFQVIKDLLDLCIGHLQLISRSQGLHQSAHTLQSRISHMLTSKAKQILQFTSRRGKTKHIQPPYSVCDRGVLEALGNEDVSRGKQHGNSLLPADDRVMPVDHAQFAYGNHSLEPMDQPLDFASRFSHGNDPNMLSSYPDSSPLARGTYSISDMSSSHSWTAPVAPSASYLPIAPAFPPALQHDYVGGPPLPGQHPPLFGAGAGFQPQVPTHVSLTAGIALHPAATFPIDAYGVPLSSEHPKKAAVPDWLREEIIKTKATIATSEPEHFKERTESIGEELIDNPIGRGDQSDNKSMDSARSTEEDEDEDEEDAQRTAAINQEIKRVLTEVLLKVTDDLFDEIATKVLSEDDYTANAVVSDNSVPVSKVSPPPPPPISAPKASAKVVIPTKAKKSKEHASGETSSGSAGNVLGLANYASDEDDGIQASSIPKFDSSGPGDAGEKGPVQIEAGGHRKNTAYTEIDNNNGRPIGVHADHGLLASKLNDHEVSKDPAKSGDDDKSTNNGHKETLNKPDNSTKILNHRMSDTDNSQERGAKRHERHDSKRSSSGRDNYKETNSNKEMEGEKDESFNRRDEKHKDKAEDSNKRERERDNKQRSPRHVEKARESSSRRRSPHREGKDSRHESHREKKSSSKDDVDMKRERTKEEKTDKSRHKSSETSRHKRRHSSPLGGRSKPIKGSPILTDDSSDESSEDSRRRNHSKKRNLSPSPDRSRRRDKRSRSRSPVRRHRR